MKYLTIFKTIANSINDEFVFSCGVLNDGGVTRHLSMAAPRQKILADFGNGFREPAGLGTMLVRSEHERTYADCVKGGVLHFQTL